MLTEQQCEKIEKGLTAQVEPRRVAAYLCLHMGLTLAEAAALRVGDIDFETVRCLSAMRLAKWRTALRRCCPATLRARSPCRRMCAGICGGTAGFTATAKRRSS